MALTKSDELLIESLLAEYEALRDEILEFQKILFRGVILFLAVISGGLSTVINIYYSNSGFREIVENNIISSLLSFTPTLVFSFWIFVISYLIQIISASTYLTKLGSKISRITSSEYDIFEWESFDGRPHIAVYSEVLSVSAVFTLALTLNITILSILYFMLDNTLTKIIYFTSLICTVLMIFSAFGVVYSAYFSRSKQREYLENASGE